MNKLKELNLDIQDIQTTITNLSKLENETDKLILRNHLYKKFDDFDKQTQEKIKKDFAQMQKEVIAETKKLLES